ncbi:hypothetical protein PENSPDRAFT_651037 [Peniophora sp. CONT]|nr:hypothetical protein PENSPDRAFT_651037 [Peniophora sp. CONT]
MDSDDELDDVRLGIGVPEHDRYDWMGRETRRMRLYEYEIQEYVDEFHGLHPEPTPEQYQQAQRMLRSYHQDRFLDTLKGYHEGVCDLSGRHPERYTRLMSRFNTLSRQFSRLLSRANLVSGEETYEIGDHTFTDNWLEYVFEEPQEWEALGKTWHIPFHSAYGFMKSLLKFTNVPAEHPMPCFQKTLLLDLPIEILENIVGECDSDSLRQLYATCRQLRLLALTDVYTCCTFTFTPHRMDMDWRQAAVRDENGISPYLRERVDNHQTLVLRQMDFLRQLPDALNRTKEISFFDSWTRDCQSSLGKFVVTGRTAEELLLPMISRLSFFIFRCPLETLHFCSQNFTGMIWDAARSSSTLRTLSINARVTEDPHNWLPALSLVNLELFLQNGFGLQMWDIIPLCPNLRYFSFESFEGRASRIPASIASPPNMFRTLTRIALQGVLAKSIRVLIQALNDAALALAPQRLPLTHFRLDVKCSLLKRDMVLQLIDALSRASIRVLSLSQLHYARPDILQHFAIGLPLLEALALRHQQRALSDTSGRSVVWPSPAYEYAVALRDFPRLMFFAFNNELCRIAYTPYYLAEAEDNYAHAMDNTKVARKEWSEYLTLERRKAIGPRDVAFHPSMRDHLDDSDSDVLPRLFATHCPTLSLLKAGYSKWSFDRHADGRIVARVGGRRTPAEDSETKRKYDMFNSGAWGV